MTKHMLHLLSFCFNMFSKIVDFKGRCTKKKKKKKKKKETTKQQIVDDKLIKVLIETCVNLNRQAIVLFRRIKLVTNCKYQI